MKIVICAGRPRAPHPRAHHEAEEAGDVGEGRDRRLREDGHPPFLGPPHMATYGFNRGSGS